MSQTIAIIGFPWDEHSSFQRGAAEAPPLIRRALFSDASNMWTETGIDLGEKGRITDAGDLDLYSSDGAREKIENAISRLLEQSLTPLSLGGDHAVSYPIVRAMRTAHPKLTVVQFDAHPDLYDEFEGDRYSHACPFARIMEEGLADRLIQIGIRTMNAHQRAQADRFGVEVIDMRAWDGALSLTLDSPVYISVDMDVFDPAFAPGVSHREPGGLSVRDVIRAIHGLRATVVGADVVELNPRNDPLGVTAVVCAKLVKELAGKMSGARVREESEER
ncbi:MAG: agmatinase [Gemmatimonadota bacterium]|nr:agmatinase [Gemmatimonadota bacterium]